MRQADLNNNGGDSCWSRLSYVAGRSRGLWAVGPVSPIGPVPMSPVGSGVSHWPSVPCTLGLLDLSLKRQLLLDL